MKKILTLLLLALILENCLAWGTLGHSFIAEKSIQTLPKELQNFYLQNIDYLKNHASDPDHWKKKDAAEPSRHYIDIDFYGKYPFLELPRNYKEAKAKFTEKTLNDYGTVPWEIEKFQAELTKNFKKKDWEKVILNTVILGHYVADSHVPFHTCLNYDGQLSGNNGIHKRFESLMIEKHKNELNFQPTIAHYIDEPLIEGFRIVLESFPYANEILKTDSLATQLLSEKMIRLLPKADEFKSFEPYYEKLYNGTWKIATERLEKASDVLGSLIFTAWIDAGKPELPENFKVEK